MSSPSLTKNEMPEFLPSLNEQERALVDLLYHLNPIWLPNKGPQTEAWLTDADELYFGGQAGGGKSDLLLGLALTAHQRSIVFRREYTQFRGEEGLLQRTANVVGAHGHFVGRINGWRLRDGRTIEFGAVETLADLQKWRGRPHDGKFFDELPEFLEAQYLFLTGWLRTTNPKQRTRIVGAGNPPSSADGEWVIRRWAPWLDRSHPNPAMPGELRWFARVDGEDVAVEDGVPFEHKGETIVPKSRTFIPSSLKDNPYLATTGYGATLQNLPEPLRSQLLYGDFAIGLVDDPWQVIPTKWVELAMARWSMDKKPSGPMTTLGCDIARGGRDKTVLAPRWANWFGPLIRHPGSETPRGQEARDFIVQSLAQGQGGTANVDVVGVGASAYDLLLEAGVEAQPINFGSGAPGLDRTNQLRFVNLRAWAYWAMREALDPDKGDDIMLPPDSELKADLVAAKWSLRVSGIQVEDKADIIKRLGRSPDAGDAVVLASLAPAGIPVAFY